jgi:hypothetical protein
MQRIVAAEREVSKLKVVTSLNCDEKGYLRECDNMHLETA